MLKILNFKSFYAVKSLGRCMNWDLPNNESHSKFLLIGFFVCLVLSSMSSLSYAQITPQGRDQTYKQAAPDRFEERFKKQEYPQSQVVPVKPDNLKPVFPAEMRKVNFLLQRMVIKGSTIYGKQKFSRLFRKYLHRRVNLQQVYIIAQKITNMYRNDGYILSKAVVPPQKIEDGVVQIDVIEGFVDRVAIQGQVRGPRKLLNKYRKALLKSRPLKAKDLERYLLLMDDLPGVSVKSVLTPSKFKQGATNLTLILSNKRYDASFGVDNRGTKFNGPFQINAGISSNALLKNYERIGIQSVVTSNTNELKFFNGFYEQTISSEGTKLFLSGSFSDSEPGSELEFFEVKGESKTFKLKITHPFIRSRSENLNGFIGYTNRDSETEILGEKDSEDRLRIFNLGASYDFVDGYQGVNLLNFNLRKGFNIFDATETGSEKLTRSTGYSDFTKVTGEALRLQQLAPSWMLLGKLSWQYSFEKLLASEEFGVGGAQFGQAYDSSEITGDQGLAFKLELQKAFKPKKKYFRDLQAYTFFDYGKVWNRFETATVSKSDDLYSMGLGIRFNITDVISGYVEWNKPLDQKVSSEGNTDGRAFFSLSARF
jgi:hemolysin activation/secretion protein